MSSSEDQSDIPPPDAVVQGPVRHPKHYIVDHLVFAVENYYYRIPVRTLRQSQYFQDMLDAEHTGDNVEGQSDEHPIVLIGITSFEIDSLLEVLNAPLIGGELVFTYEQWTAALHLATMWAFEDVRSYVINKLDAQLKTTNLFERIRIADKCRVEKWLHSAYKALCDREEPLSAAEGEFLGFQRMAAICRIREKCSSRRCDDCYNCHRSNSTHPCANRERPTMEMIKESRELAVPEA